MPNWPADSDMARRIREQPWTETLGPMDAWPAALASSVRFMLNAHGPVSVCWGNDLVFLYNDAWRELLADRHPTALGRPAREVFPELNPLLQDVLDGRGSAQTDDRYLPRRRQGQLQDAWFSFTATPVQLDNGSVGGVLTMAFDTTELVQCRDARDQANRQLESFAHTEQRLRDSEERLRIMVESARDYAIFTLDEQRRVTSWPAGAQAVFGWAPEEIIGESADILFTPEDIAAGQPEQESAQARETGHAPDVRWHVRKDGGAVFIEGSMRPLGAECAGRQGFVKIGQDITERRRAEIALRESEERFQQFAAASADVLWIRDARTLEMEFLSPAFETVYGSPVSRLLGRGPQEWAAMVVPDDREEALAALHRACQHTVVHEFRIMRASDGAFRWIRSTDFPLHDAAGTVRRIGGIAEDITEPKQLTGHQAVLLAELQHRVRNIMAMIRAVAARTPGTADTAQQYARTMVGRLTALARTQTLLTRAPSAGVDIATLVSAEMEAMALQADHYIVSGPRIAISPKAAEVLTLAMHELATNALKYGAFSSPEGKVEVRWRVSTARSAPWLHLQWIERMPPQSEWTPPKRRGFGSELIERRVPYELGGIGSVDIRAGAVDATIAFPLQEGASILETDTPVPLRVHGGAIDMSAEADLTGKRVLVLEDDYYLAADACQALRSAGAECVGPYASEAAALERIRNNGINAAVVDINLGPGPSFRMADALMESGVPFVFVTGYDHSVIPDRFASTPRFSKPADLREVVRAVAALG